MPENDPSGVLTEKDKEEGKSAEEKARERARLAKIYDEYYGKKPRFFKARAKRRRFIETGKVEKEPGRVKRMWMNYKGKARLADDAEEFYEDVMGDEDKKGLLTNREQKHAGRFLKEIKAYKAAGMPGPPPGGGIYNAAGALGPALPILGGAAAKGLGGAVGGGGGGLLMQPLENWMKIVSGSVPDTWITGTNQYIRDRFFKGLDFVGSEGVVKPVKWGVGKAKDLGKAGLKAGWKATLGDISERPKDYAPKIFGAIAPTFIGVLFAALTNNLWFLFGFMSIGIVLISPGPEDTAAEGFGLFGWRKGSSGGLAFIRSIAKTSAIVCFAVGFRLMGDIFNFLLILVCFFGYFALKIEVDPRSPAEIIESLIRFGFLGAYFIPFYIFGGIFHSTALILITLAFFAVPPVFSRGRGFFGFIKNVGAETGEMITRLMFTVIMIFVLVGVMTGLFDLTGTGTLKYVFLYFWVITFIGGVSSPAVSRPMIGALMLVASTIIFGIGPGSQDVGSALFGQWWPTLHNTVEQGLEPVSEMFGTLTDTFGTTFQLMINPVGFAHEIVEGSYVRSDAEKIGAYGIEIEEIRTTPLYVTQPFNTIVKVKNVGSFEGRNIVLTIDSKLEYRKGKHDIDDFIANLESTVSKIDVLAGKATGTLTCPDSILVCPDGETVNCYNSCEEGRCRQTECFKENEYNTYCLDHIGEALRITDNKCPECSAPCPDGTIVKTVSTYDPVTKKCGKCAAPDCSSHSVGESVYCASQKTSEMVEEIVSGFSYPYDELKIIATDVYDESSEDMKQIGKNLKESIVNATDWESVGSNLYGILKDTGDHVIGPATTLIFSDTCKNQMRGDIKTRWDELKNNFKSILGVSIPAPEEMPVIKVPRWKGVGVVKDVLRIAGGIVKIFIDLVEIMIDVVRAAICQIDRLDTLGEEIKIRDPKDPGRGFVNYTKEELKKELLDLKGHAETLLKNAKMRVGAVLDAIDWEGIINNITDSVGRTTTIAKKIKDLFVETGVLDRRSMGFTDENTPVKLLGNLLKKDVRQVFFDSGGIECTIAAGTELRKKFIPMNVSVIYDYEADSDLSIDFISNEEWRRRVAGDELVTGIVQSRMVTSPVKLSISTFDQPLRENQPFAVGFEIKSGEGKQSVMEDGTIEIFYPSEFGNTKCVGAGEIEMKGCDSEECKIVWEVSEAGEEGKAIWCNFENAGIEMGDAPTKTYIVKAHADYTFRRWETENTEIRFGGYCCSDDDCIEGKKCTGGSCISKDIKLFSGETERQAEIRTAVSPLAARPATTLSSETVVMVKMGPEGDGKVNISGKTFVYKDGVLTKDDVKEYLERFSGMIDAEGNFFDIGKGKDIDPAFAVAVAMVETSGGKYLESMECKNPFNLGYEKSKGVTDDVSVMNCEENKEIASFVSFDESIKKFYNLLYKYCISDGKTTVKQIAESGCLKEGTSVDEWENSVAHFRTAVQKIAIDRVKEELMEAERDKWDEKVEEEEEEHVRKTAHTRETIVESVRSAEGDSREEKMENWKEARKGKVVCFKGKIDDYGIFGQTGYMFGYPYFKIRVWDQDQKLLGDSVSDWTGTEKGDTVSCKDPPKESDDECFVSDANWVCICGTLKYAPHSYYVDVTDTC